jgi:hypothetical protein
VVDRFVDLDDIEFDGIAGFEILSLGVLDARRHQDVAEVDDPEHEGDLIFHSHRRARPHCRERELLALLWEVDVVEILW